MRKNGLMTGLYKMREMLKDALESIKNTIKESDNPYLLRMKLKKKSFAASQLATKCFPPVRLQSIPFRTPVQFFSESRSDVFGLQFNQLWTPVQPALDSSPVGLGLQSNRLRKVANLRHARQSGRWKEIKRNGAIKVLLALQTAYGLSYIDPGCRFACPRLWAFALWLSLWPPTSSTFSAFQKILKLRF